MSPEQLVKLIASLSKEGVRKPGGTVHRNARGVELSLRDVINLARMVQQGQDRTAFYSNALEGLTGSAQVKAEIAQMAALLEVDPRFEARMERSVAAWKEAS
jgi:hypothetical protein